MSIHENILNHILSKHGEAIESGGLNALLQTPPLKIMIFGSYERGAALLRACSEDDYLKPWIKVVGIVTDDPEKYPALAKTRIWKYPEAYAKRKLVEDLAHEKQIPVFTDIIKNRDTGLMTPRFENFLADTNPDLALMGTFGQLITQPIIDAFDVGFLNFHPTGEPQSWPHPDDVGPAPFEGMIARNCRRAHLALHWVNAKFDNGPMIWFTEGVEMPAGATPVQMHELTSAQVPALLKCLIRYGVESHLEGIINLGPCGGDVLPRSYPDRPTNAGNAKCASSVVRANIYAAN